MEDIVIAKINEAKEDLNALSQDLWSNPETAFKEHHAHDLLTNFLTNQGFKVEKHFVLPTGFRATFGNDKGRTVALMAEYDSLPEIGHACGHNLIAESSIGAALGIKAALESVELTQQMGKVIVIGSPAEEQGGGKVYMLEQNMLENVDAALMAHPCMDSMIDAKMTARVQVKYQFHGKAAHASMSPWMGCNALDAAVQFYNSVSALRQQMKPGVRIHGVFTNGGAQPNIIPEEAELLYYLRAPTTDDLEPVIRKCELCANGAATSADCTVDIEYVGYYAEVITNHELAMVYKKHCEDLGVTFPQDEAILRSTGGSTDMGNVSFVVPSIHPMFDINTEAPNHSREFTKCSGAPEAQAPTLLQAKALALTAISLLKPGGEMLMKTIQDEFAKVKAPSILGQKISLPPVPEKILT